MCPMGRKIAVENLLRTSSFYLWYLEMPKGILWWGCSKTGPTSIYWMHCSFFSGRLKKLPHLRFNLLLTCNLALKKSLCVQDLRINDFRIPFAILQPMLNECCFRWYSQSFVLKALKGQRHCRHLRSEWALCNNHLLGRLDGSFLRIACKESWCRLEHEWHSCPSILLERVVEVVFSATPQATAPLHRT